MNESFEKYFDLVITGANVILENGSTLATIGITNGKITAIVDPQVKLPAMNVIDATGKVILPGLIDPHVHLWEPGPLNYREDFLHGTRAAAAGGISTIIEMPLSVPPVIDKESFDLKYNIAINNSSIDFALWGGLIPASVHNLEELHELGCVAFKAFMSQDNDKYPYTPDFELWQAMKKVAKFDGIVAVHAENGDIIKKMGNMLEATNELNPEIHADSRPEIAEIEAVQKAILFAEKTGCRLYIVHLSTTEAIEMVKRAKARGVKVYSETCHHYLLFDRTALTEHGSFIKCNPPLRTRETVDGLWEQILNGDVDSIGSDHAPYTDDEQKDTTIWNAPPGFGGIELILPVMLSEGYHKRGLSLEAIAQITSTNAAKIFGLYPQKGAIRLGADADLAIVDLNKEWVYDGKNSLAKIKSEHSPYHNVAFKGKLSTTIVRGTVVYQDGTIEVEPGFGSFIRR